MVGLFAVAQVDRRRLPFEGPNYLLGFWPKWHKKRIRVILAPTTHSSKEPGAKKIVKVGSKCQTQKKTFGWDFFATWVSLTCGFWELWWHGGLLVDSWPGFESLSYFVCNSACATPMQHMPDLCCRVPWLLPPVLQHYLRERDRERQREKVRETGWSSQFQRWLEK